NKGLDPAARYRAYMGLGRAADQRGSPQTAKGRYTEAWRAASSDALRDRALVALARTEVSMGDAASARAHRDAIKDRGVDGFAEIDRALAGAAAAPRAPSPAPAAAPTPATAGRPPGRGLKPPQIHGRSTWGARPPNRRETEAMGKPTLVTIHHTADKKIPGADYQDNLRQMQAYQNGHQARGWADVGYHFVIDKAGRIWEGRPLHLKGAHAGSNEANEHNVGVALIGNFEKTDPTAKQTEALEDLVLWLCAEYGIPDRRVYTHHQIKDWPGVRGATNCPGKRFAPYLARLKRALAAAAKAPGRGR
ncbi:MAG TPA: peptidoglycan recognition family protein, partial [Planctomycetota bacterium]|nr:peptidoglycan recognition family protein [Planctomycetota bacterium]